MQISKPTPQKIDSGEFKFSGTKTPSKKAAGVSPVKNFNVL